MCTSASSHRYLGSMMLFAVGLAGCGVDPLEYQFGFNITGVEFNLHSEDMGVHPNLDILDDPNNPFVDNPVGRETKWEILAGAGNAATFYAWGTILAFEPGGEHQFFTAVQLRNIYETEEVPEEQLPIVRDMAVRGFQSLLDNFPESVTFDAAGENSTRLATFAFNEITNLGAQVQGDWVLVQLPNGGTEAVRSAAQDPGRAMEDDDNGG